MIVCETPRLRLRHFSLDDAAFIIRLLNEPSFIENIEDKGVRTIEDAHAYLLGGPMASYQRLGFGLNRVELKDSAVPIGMCGLLKRDALPDADIGYALLPEYCSNGYAVEAASAILDTAQDGHDLKRVLALVNPGNETSIRLLQRLGFASERMICVDEGKPHIMLFGIDVRSRHAA